ncbi:MAG: MerR family transcriptional regulator [Alistipes sp.]|nr:MerR family transcriptional regulator [Alistipes sp.]
MADKKLYYSMGEVAEMFDVNPSLIRHWESKFDCVRPHKNKKGNRMFSPQDVEKLKLIYHLVKERGMTLEGANKVLKRRSGGNELSRDMELLERLQRIRASLVAVREELKGNVDGELVASDVEEEVTSIAQSFPTVAQPESGEQEVVSDEPIAQQENAPQPKSKRKSVVQKITEDDAQEHESSPQPKKRVVRRKKKDEEDKELFPFYEQSLF